MTYEDTECQDTVVTRSSVPRSPDRHALVVDCHTDVISSVGHLRQQHRTMSCMLTTLTTPC